MEQRWSGQNEDPACRATWAVSGCISRYNEKQPEIRGMISEDTTILFVRFA